MSETWVTLLPLFRLVFASFEGVGAVAIVDYLKGKWVWLTGKKLPGEFGLLLTFGVCFFLAALALVVEGVLSPDSLTQEELITTFVAVFTVAKVRYDMVRKKQTRERARTLVNILNSERDR